MTGVQAPRVCDAAGSETRASSTPYFVRDTRNLAYPMRSGRLPRSTHLDTAVDRATHAREHSSEGTGAVGTCQLEVDHLSPEPFLVGDSEQRSPDFFQPPVFLGEFSPEVVDCLEFHLLFQMDPVSRRRQGGRETVSFRDEGPSLWKEPGIMKKSSLSSGGS